MSKTADTHKYNKRVLGTVGESMGRKRRDRNGGSDACEAMHRMLRHRLHRP